MQGDSQIRLVVGLGNPGSQYQGTRHNVGFEILDRLASGSGASWKREKKWEAEVARAEEVFWVKPQTFMNLSGRTVAGLAGFFKLRPENTLVVYDDVDLPLGRLRFRTKGSAGGHNGIKSIIQSLGSDQFPRLKFGVGRPAGAAGSDAPQGKLSGHVLGRFSREEEDELEKSLAKAVEAVNDALSRGLEPAMNRFNQDDSKPARKKKTKPEPQGGEAVEADGGVGPENTQS